jgi:Mn2+/Fe2+ NRAMP family transporter
MQHRVVDEDEPMIFDINTDKEDRSRITQKEPSSWKQKLLHFFMVVGPGLAVMLADTDAGCLVTAAQSGAQWGYCMVIINIILIPVVFAAQELTVRLAIYTKKGQAELIKEHYGKFWAWFAAVVILITCTGAVTSEISGMMGVGEIFGIPYWASALITDAFLMSVVFTGSYERVEKIAIVVGLFELVFVVTMFLAFPSPDKFISGMAFPITNPDYLSLVAANIGAVIMPWMIFYQQSASVVRDLKKRDLKMERIETGVGACITQIVMIAAIMTTAGTIWDGNLPSANTLNSIPDISSAITPHLGYTAGRILFSLGMIGGAMIGAIVVTITASWTLGEVLGFGRDLNKSPREAPGFYIAYVAILIVATVITCLLPDYLVDINIAAEVLNAVLVPVVLCFTFLLSMYHLPEEIRLKGIHSIFIGIVFAVCSIFSIGATAYSLYQNFSGNGGD